MASSTLPQKTQKPPRLLTKAEESPIRKKRSQAVGEPKQEGRSPLQKKKDKIL